jgi:predicted Rossmann-fold nucleotide-binding protein
MITNNNLQEIEGVVAHLKSVPFDVTVGGLYSAAQLYHGYEPECPQSYEECYDQHVYQHFLLEGKQTGNMKEQLARTLHDYRIHVGIRDFMARYDNFRCIGIMGGHALLRTDDMFRKVAFLSKRLTERHFYMISGGGPGAMEATHLGAWMAGRTDEEMDAALAVLQSAPSFHDERWLSTAFRVMQQYPQQKYVSLGIPTWLYGHEPSTPFATHIAKFFENSIREDSILTLAFGGIVYTPGSAGTMQEIFQDAVQNHYLSFGFSSPMIFLGSRFWTEEMPVYPLLESLEERGKYKNLRLGLTDDIGVVVEVLERFSMENITKNK